MLFLKRKLSNFIHSLKNISDEGMKSLGKTLEILAPEKNVCVYFDL